MHFTRVLVGLCLCAGLARAEKPHPRAAAAREQFEQATTHFAIGEFAKAGQAYQEAYRLRPDPAFLYNAAQAYRLANQPDKALILYKNYLNLYPNEPNGDEVRAQIAKLKEAIAAAEQAQSNPPTEAAAPRAVSPEPASPPETAAPAPSAPFAEPRRRCTGGGGCGRSSA